jgi:beta-glucanase (GH16 family)
MSLHDPDRPFSIMGITRLRALMLLIWGCAMAIAVVLLVGAEAGGNVPAEKPVSGPPAGMSAKLAFSDDFEGQAVDPDRWAFAYYNRDREQATIAKRNLWGNRERQVYFDTGFLKLGIDPFRVSDGTLKIESRPLTDVEIARVKEAVAKQPTNIASTSLKDVRYSSGLISSRARFQQQYGYFEMRARWSGGKGLWPAFWLLPASGGWPPEIDIVEAHGDKPGVSFHSLHSKHVKSETQKATSPTADGGFHNYGVLWLPERIDFYVDGRRTATMPTRADMHQPMYMIANLAVGGYWPGDPDAATKFPATLEIDHIKVWTVDEPPTS